ncbi:MAG: hypothetical protein ABI596_11790 [Pyrinomonadaceae bacterium]
MPIIQAALSKPKAMPPNDGINRRAFNAGAAKLSMKGQLTRVRFNDLLARGRPYKVQQRRVSR